MLCDAEVDDVEAGGGVKTEPAAGCGTTTLGAKPQRNSSGATGGVMYDFRGDRDRRREL